MKDKVDHAGGHDVNWFTIGDAAKAQEVKLIYDKGGHCAIRYKRHNGEDGHAFDCKEGKFHDGNDVLGYNNHKSGGQWFMVN